MWEVWINEDGGRHVVPQEDLKPHFHDQLCWCKPQDDDGIWVHNSMDLREMYEKGRKPS
jgi:hypothetical protein